MDVIEIGKSVPNFELSDQNEKIRSLSEWRGKWIVLYFYPKDNTPGCSLEAQDFSRMKEEFEKNGAIVVGVSPNGAKSHLRFIEKKEINFDLLCDEEKKVLSMFGVWKLKKLYGREYMGVERSTFLIDPEGHLAFEWRKVKVKEHAQLVLEKLKELQGN